MFLNQSLKPSFFIVEYTDVIFKQDKWIEKKKRIVNYFKNQFINQVLTQYAGYYTICKVLSCASIVSMNVKFL